MESMLIRGEYRIVLFGDLPKLKNLRQFEHTRQVISAILLLAINLKQSIKSPGPLVIRCTYSTFPFCKLIHVTDTGVINIFRMRKESGAWDELLEYHTDMATQAHRYHGYSPQTNTVAPLLVATLNRGYPV